MTVTCGYMQSILLERRMLAPIFHVIKSKSYLGILLASGLAYASFYMVAVGVIRYGPGLTSFTDNYPMIRLYSIGILVIPAPDVFFFIFYDALAFVIVSSFFVGLNVALTFYSRRLAAVCRVRKPTGLEGFLGLLPAFFTSFACCGGGLMVSVIGAIAFSSLSLYSRYMAPLTVAVLALGTFSISDKISKMKEGSCCGKG
ncbi:hypothetical protein HRbin02_00951 [Candidatus Calditenuaceae archaeon HR02]|nr:hypothetical protein HRbin02_00951 [Candidatus Calditenuaceae archaeon HR02]